MAEKYELLNEMPEVYGELKERISLSTARLCGAVYRPAAIYTQDQAGWPGDWEGRTVLALVSQWFANGTEPAYLKQIIKEIPTHFNSKGYLGEIYDNGIFNEQQLSGHNWLLRGFLEYYRKTGDEKILKIATNLVNNLYKPLKGYYDSYPLDPEKRATIGDYAGTVTGNIDGWITSSDIGCAFMCLDGLGHFYKLTKDEEVHSLLDEMIAKFESIDFVGSHMQTHATLSATRGILAVYEGTGDEKYLDVAKKIFKLYREEGMTENFANFNWFGRFDTWTEPCAITDSLMVSLSLFRNTGDTSYLKLAQRIYYNAFCYAQRYNGGFGLDTTVGPNTKYLKPNGPGIQEAFWCCSMRGAEGLRAMAEHLFLKNENEIFITFAFPSRLETDGYVIEVSSEIPYKDSFEISIEAKKDINFTLKVFDGESFLSYNTSLKLGERKTLEGKISLKNYEENALHVKGRKIFRGNLLLGKNNEDELAPLTDMKDIMGDKVAKENRQIVFD